MRLILLAALVLAGSLFEAPACGAAPVSIYHCDGARSFSVRLTASSAKVSLEGTQFTLPRRASSIGQKYASADGPLILDGDFAAFVTRQDTGLSGCNRVTRSARL